MVTQFRTIPVRIYGHWTSTKELNKIEKRLQSYIGDPLKCQILVKADLRRLRRLRQDIEDNPRFEDNVIER